MRLWQFKLSGKCRANSEDRGTDTLPSYDSHSHYTTTSHLVLNTSIVLVRSRTHFNLRSSMGFISQSHPEVSLATVQPEYDYIVVGESPSFRNLQFSLRRDKWLLSSRRRYRRMRNCQQALSEPQTSRPFGRTRTSCWFLGLACTTFIVWFRFRWFANTQSFEYSSSCRSRKVIWTVYWVHTGRFFKNKSDDLRAWLTSRIRCLEGCWESRLGMGWYKAVFCQIRESFIRLEPVGPRKNWYVHFGPLVGVPLFKQR